MEIKGIHEPDSVKIVCTLRMCDFSDTFNEMIRHAISEDLLYWQLTDTDQGDVTLQSEAYPYEKIKEALIETDTGYLTPLLIKTFSKELASMIFVCTDFANRLSDAIREFENAPLEINFDLDSWN